MGEWRGEHFKTGGDLKFLSKALQQKDGISDGEKSKIDRGNKLPSVNAEIIRDSLPHST